MSAGPATPAPQRGATTVAEVVVAKVAAGAVQRVPGVHAVGAAPVGVGASGQHRPGSTRGVSVQVGPDRTSVSVELVAVYGTSLPGVAEAVRRSVAQSVEALTGLQVTAVDVMVTDVRLSADGDGDGDSDGQPRVVAPRPWAAGPGHLPRTRTSAR